MSNRASRAAPIGAVICAPLSISAASASAGTLFVSNSAAPLPGGKSCVQPNYNRIQEAISAGASTIDVCAGTYTEQLTVRTASRSAPPGP